MVRSSPILLIAVVAVHGCATPQRDRCEHVFGVVASFTIAPDGEFQTVKFHEPIDCRGESTSLVLPRGWLRTACVALLGFELNPTYSAGEIPKEQFLYFLHDSDSPDVVYPPRGFDPPYGRAFVVGHDIAQIEPDPDSDDPCMRPL